jgi:hypothetical protein
LAIYQAFNNYLNTIPSASTFHQKLKRVSPDARFFFYGGPFVKAIMPLVQIPSIWDTASRKG